MRAQMTDERYVGANEVYLLQRSIALCCALRPDDPNVLGSLTVPPSSSSASFRLPLNWDATAVRLFAKKCKPLYDKNGCGYINDGAVTSVEAVFTGCRLLWIMADVRNNMPHHGQVRDWTEYYSGISYAIKIAEKEYFPPCAFSTVGALLRNTEVPVLQMLFKSSHHTVTNVDDTSRKRAAAAMLVFDVMGVEFLRQGVFDDVDPILKGDKQHDGMMIMDAALFGRLRHAVHDVAQVGKNTLLQDVHTLMRATAQWPTACGRRVNAFMEMCAADHDRRPIMTILYEKMVTTTTPSPRALEAETTPPDPRSDAAIAVDSDRNREEDTKNNKMYGFHDPVALVSMWASSSDSEPSSTTGARTGLCFMECLRFVTRVVVPSLTRSSVAQAQKTSAEAGLSAQYGDMLADMARAVEDVLVSGNVDRIDDVGSTDMWQVATSARFWTSCDVNVRKEVMDDVHKASPRHYSLLQYVRSRGKQNDKLAAFDRSTTALRAVARQPLRRILLRRVIRHVEDGLDFGASGVFLTAGVDATAFMKRLAQKVFGKEDDPTMMTIEQEMVAAIICVQVWTSRLMYDARARDNLACYAKNAYAIETRLREKAATTSSS